MLQTYRSHSERAATLQAHPSLDLLSPIIPFLAGKAKKKGRLGNRHTGSHKDVRRGEITIEEMILVYNKLSL
jgi:hypothetical protein